MNARIRSLQYGASYPHFCFAVTINQATTGVGYTYELHFNETLKAQTTEGPSTSSKIELDDALDLTTFQNSERSGMLGITTFINNLILQT
jgi:hypothetical protein